LLFFLCRFLISFFIDILAEFFFRSFQYPKAEEEEKIVIKESGIDAPMAKKLVKIVQELRRLKESEIHEDVSTRLLVYTAKLIKEGFPPKEACRHAIVESLTDDEETIAVLEQLVALHFDEVEG
jgi:nitric oxide reductase NorQ protein